MIRRYSLTWQKEWKICQKEDSAVITAMHFVWKKLLRKLRKLEQIILQQHFQIPVPFLYLENHFPPLLDFLHFSHMI